MRTNKQSKIVVPKSGFKRSRFNWSHDVNTTFAWGEMQPTQCKMLIPGSKTTMDAQTLIRLAPMVAPTFGRVKYKTFNQFVSFGEIFPNFDAMMAQEPVSTAGATKVPQSLPNCLLGRLSSWVLQGARATVYFAEAGTYQGVSMTAQQAQQAGYYTTYYRDSPLVGGTTNWLNHMNHLTVSGGPVSASPASDAFNNAANGVLPDITGITLTLGKFGSRYNNVFGNTTPVVLSARSVADLCPVKRDYSAAGVFPIKDYQQEITWESADFVLEGEFEYSSGNFEYFAVLVEMSDFGKRLCKVLQGCGYQINFTSNSYVSLLPLFATYKSYFDIFGLELYQGWETTFCAKAIKYIENAFLTNLDSVVIRDGKAALATLDSSNFMMPFIMMELSNMWFTDDVDYISAHLDKLAVSHAADNTFGTQVGGFVDWATTTGALSSSTGLSQYGNAQVVNGMSPAQSEGATPASGGHLALNTVNHTALDSQLLMRMYKWTNRNTILGRRIAELLRAQGLGKYVDECKSNYIGSTDTMVTISDVVSTAATADASLGEYGGKGLQYVNDKTLVFENDSYGYWVTLCTVIPESGYTQGIDPTLTSLDKMNLYNPDFDAIGMEATPKRNVVATNYIVGGADGEGDTFGFIPRYSKFKVCKNLVNGDFNRHGLRSTYLPYTLDKQLNINDYSVTLNGYDSNNKKSVVLATRSTRSDNLPVAGNVWRYPAKYNWLGNFDRILSCLSSV